MGGNVFINTHNVVRLNKEDYNRYVNEISEHLHSIGIKTFFPTQAIKDKEDFGDMDVIVSSNAETKSLALTWLHNFYPYQSNGEVVSFLYKRFQIDLIFIAEKSYNYACNYFSHNDLGNLLGRMAKQLGFKHGHEGLYYVQRDGDATLKEHLLSTSYLDILNILKLDKLKFKNGFENYQDLFDYVMSSPYYNPDIFKLENLNNTNRVRDRKRKTYNLFLKYAEEKKDLYPPISKLTKEDRTEFVFNLYPNLRKETEAIQAEYDLKKSIASKTNGNFLMELIPELKGKELGQFISYLKDNSVKLYSATVLTLSEEEIKDLVLYHYKEYKK